MQHHLIGGLGLERLLLQHHFQPWKAFTQFGAMRFRLLLQQTHHKHISVPVLQAGGREGEPHQSPAAQRLIVAIPFMPVPFQQVGC